MPCCYTAFHDHGRTIFLLDISRAVTTMKKMDLVVNCMNCLISTIIPLTLLYHSCESNLGINALSHFFVPMPTPKQKK